jgi:signal transduction histidine kinase
VHTQQLVDEVVAALGLTAKTKGLELTVDYPSEPVWVRTDRRALSQILLNLASNAIKFTSRGSVCLQVRGKAEGSPYRVTLSVVDSGIGIRKDDLERLFQAFEQLDNGGQRQLEGSGLGLHLSHKLSAVLGGDLLVASAIGAGSTFSLRLPDLP